VVAAHGHLREGERGEIRLNQLEGTKRL
jgi:hypothetical protein